MRYVVVLWVVWAALALVLLGLILYRISLTQYEEDQIFLDDADGALQRRQDWMLAKLKRLEPAIRISGGVEGLVTLAIVAFYVLDALRQF